MSIRSLLSDRSGHPNGRDSHISSQILSNPVTSQLYLNQSVNSQYGRTQVTQEVVMDNVSNIVHPVTGQHHGVQVREVVRERVVAFISRERTSISNANVLFPNQNLGNTMIPFCSAMGNLGNPTPSPLDQTPPHVEFDVLEYTPAAPINLPLPEENVDQVISTQNNSRSQPQGKGISPPEPTSGTGTVASQKVRRKRRRDSSAIAKTDQPKKHGPYTCPRCGEVFEKSQKLASHVRCLYLREETAEEREARRATKNMKKALQGATLMAVDKAEGGEAVREEPDAAVAVMKEASN